jgi:hypothetical protein
MSASDTRPVHTGEPDSVVSRGVEHLGPLASGSGRRSEPEPPQAPAFVIPDLPWAYEDDRLVLLVRDPKTLFAYWDFHPDTIRQAFENVPAGRAFLRVLQLGGSEPKVLREIEIDLGFRAYYLYDCEPNRDYRVELFARGVNHAEAMLGRPSNVATLPANRPSTWVEDRFASIPLDLRLPVQSLFSSGRVVSDPEKRAHLRAYELSGGDFTGAEGPDLSSGELGVRGFGGRSWSGTLVKK